MVKMRIKDHWDIGCANGFKLRAAFDIMLMEETDVMVFLDTTGPEDGRYFIPESTKIKAVLK